MNNRALGGALSKEELRKIRLVQLKMDHIATELLAGMYRSAFKGRGMEFEEVREFQPGDEIRSIDWNVTARAGYPYVKIFREERELTVYLLVDISASTRFGTVNALKSDILSEIGAVLAFSGIKNQDKLGLILFSQKVEHYLPPSKGIRHVLRLIRDLMAFQAEGKGTSLANALHFLGKVQKKRSVVFILSDFQDEGGWNKEMSVIAKLHDVIALHIQDPREKFMPKLGLITFQDLETGNSMLVNTNSFSVNDTLQKASLSRVANARKVVETSGGAWVEISTDRPYIYDLKKFFASRGKAK